ncbi:unnamed protein product [Caenorhabditis auriculariae]|uniref:Uncharacterized protein n=1 Tax=Caenorhabditis auriculariae TaxID=2777116 RepID=A0A8S1HCD8_9PELO|nr:unnamed protein product [Caenorhabditis auriculariae]
MDNPTRDEGRQQDQGRPPPEQDAQDPPPPTHSLRLSPQQVEDLAEFLEWNQLLRGRETASYEVAVRRDRRGAARLELTLVGAATTPQIDSGEVVPSAPSVSNKVGERVEEKEGKKEEELKDKNEEEKEKTGEEAQPPEISNKTEVKMKFTAVHEPTFRYHGAQTEIGREPLRAATESHARSVDPGGQRRRGKEKARKARKGKVVAQTPSTLAERLDEEPVNEMRTDQDDEERGQNLRRMEADLLDLESPPATRHSPESEARQEEPEEQSSGSSSSSSSSAPWPEELEDVYELFDLESMEEFDDETGSSDSSDSFFLGQHARERIALAWARRNLLELEEDVEEGAEVRRAEDPEPPAAERVADEVAEVFLLEGDNEPEAEEREEAVKEEKEEDEKEDEKEAVEDEEANDQAGPATQPAAAPQQAAAGVAGSGQARKQPASQRPRRALGVAQRASRRLMGLGVGQAVRRVPPALAGLSPAQLLLKIREELEAKLRDGGSGDEELRKVGRLSSARTSLEAIQKGRHVTGVQMARILRKIEGGY